MIPGSNWFAALMAALALCSCSTVEFYSQAMKGQAEIWKKKRPVEEVLADKNEPEMVKQKLRLVLELREYAKNELKLPAESFGTYSDLKRPYVVWVVYAAEAFKVEPKEWWYPLVGKLGYRGFFTQEDARAEAVRLKDQGHDVFAGGVEAYSTLGFFNDPVLNTCLHRSDASLAELIFHELTHSKLFIPGDTDFNEAFATANAEAAVRRWLKALGRHSQLREYEQPQPSLEATQVELLSLQKKLAKLGFTEKATDVQDGSDVRLTWNNARLNTVATYHSLVPGFEKMLRGCGGDVEFFYSEVEKMRPMSKEERRRQLGVK
jgi:predicted aminopeptidase